MRLLHRAITPPKVTATTEIETIDLATQPSQLDHQARATIGHRLAVISDPGAELRRHAALKDRQLDGGTIRLK